MSQSKKDEKGTGSWDFKLDTEVQKELDAPVTTADRLKEQKEKAKLTNTKNLKVTQKKISLTRTQLAEQESKSHHINQSNVSSELRLKSSLADLLFLCLLYILAKSSFVLNPLALGIIQYFKSNNIAYYLENLPDFKLILVALIYLGFFLLFYLLPTVLTARSPGKWIFKIKVEDEEGGQPNRNTMLARETVGKLLSLLSVYGIYLTFVEKKGLGLHDKMFSTVVILHSSKKA